MEVKRKNKAISRSNDSRRRLPVWVWFVLVCLSLYLALFTVIVINRHFRLNAAYDDMQQYLSKKYSEKFIIEKTTLQNSAVGLDSYASWSASVYPARDSSLKFRVTLINLHQNGKYMPTDNYMATLWSQSETQRVHGMLENQLLQVTVTIKLSPELEKSETLSRMTITDLLKHHPKEVRYVIRASHKGRADGQRLLTVAQGLFTLAGKLRQEGVRNISFEYYEYGDWGDFHSSHCSESNGATSEVDKLKDCISSGVHHGKGLAV